MKPVLTRKKPILPMGLIIALCIGVDQLTKLLAVQFLSPLVGTAYLSGLIRLILAQNSGMFSSLGVGLPAHAKFWLFTVGVSLLLCGLLLYLLLSTRIDRTTLLAGAMIVGGGLSNVLDRLFHGGMVIDFIYLVIAGWVSDVFNLADLAISMGLVIMLWSRISRSKAA